LIHILLLSFIPERSARRSVFAYPLPRYLSSSIAPTGSRFRIDTGAPPILLHQRDVQLPYGIGGK
jgi:hypothetical protein